MSYIARFDGRQFSAVGAGLDGEVSALVVHDDDGSGPHAPALYAAGSFSGSGPVTAHRVAKWDGVSWSAVGTGLEISGQAFALASFDPDGPGPLPARLVAGGMFNSSGLRGVAQWDGSAWLPMGAGFFGYVGALAVYDPDGDGPLPPSLYAAGDLGSPSFGYIARWDGAAWQPVGGGVNGQVTAMAVYDDDGPGPHLPRLYVGGFFTSAAGAAQSRYLARWDGTSWAGVPGPVTNWVNSLAVADVDGDGVPELYVSGQLFQVGTTPPIVGIARFDGTSWSAVGSGLDEGAFAMALYDDDGTGPHRPGLFTTGPLSIAGGVSSEGFARWGCPLPACYANCDGSAGAPLLNVNDFVCFLNRFAARDPWANCDGSTTPPVLNALDFTCFLNAFSAGCP